MNPKESKWIRVDKNLNNGEHPTLLDETIKVTEALNNDENIDTYAHEFSDFTTYDWLTDLDKANNSEDDKEGKEFINYEDIPKDIIKKIVDSSLQQFDENFQVLSTSNKLFEELFKGLYKATYIVLDFYSDLSKHQQEDILNKFLQIFSWTWESLMQNRYKNDSDFATKAESFACLFEKSTQNRYNHDNNLKSEAEFIIFLYLEAVMRIVTDQGKKIIIDYLMQKSPTATNLLVCWQDKKHNLTPSSSISHSLDYTNYIMQIGTIVSSIKTNTNMLDTDNRMEDIAIAFTTLKEFVIATNLNPSNYLPKFYGQAKAPIKFDEVYRASTTLFDLFLENATEKRTSNEKPDFVEAAKKELGGIKEEILGFMSIISCHPYMSSAISRPEHASTVKKALSLLPLKYNHIQEKNIALQEFLTIYKSLNDLTDKSDYKRHGIDVNKLKLEASVNLLKVLTPTHRQYLFENLQKFAPKSAETAVYLLINQLTTTNIIANTTMFSLLDAIYDSCTKLDANAEFIKIGVFIYQVLPMNTHTLPFIQYCLEKSYEALIELFAPSTFEVPEDSSNQYIDTQYPRKPNTIFVTIREDIRDSIHSPEELDEYLIHYLQKYLLLQIKQALTEGNSAITASKKDKTMKMLSCHRATDSIIMLYSYANTLMQKQLLQSFNELNSIIISLLSSLDKGTIKDRISNGISTMSRKEEIK